MELARIAVTQGRAELASNHLKEALELDPRLKRARERLQDVEQLSEAVRDRVRGRRKKVVGLLRRLRRK
jgi:phage shock protein A